MLLSNLKISRKLIIAFAVVIGILVVANGALFLQLQNIRSASAAHNDAAEAVLEVSEIMASILEQQNAIRAYSVSPDARFIETYNQNVEQTTKRLDAFVAHAKTPDVRARRQKLKAAYDEWRANKAQRQLDLLTNPATHAEGAAMTGQNTLTEVRAVMAEIRAVQAKRDDEAGLRQLEVIGQSEIILAVSALLALATASAMALLLSKTIGQPVSEITGVMRKLSEGDNTVDVPGMGRKDEIGEMAEAVQTFKAAAIEKLRLEGMTAEQAKAAEEERRRQEAAKAEAARQQQKVVEGIATGLEKLAAGDLLFRLNEPFAEDYEKLRADFNDAMGQLQETMKVITGNTRGLRSGAEEISQAADDLSKRTEQQAASLEETAAALDQITATVRKTAEGANHARDVVSTARADAERSGEIVSQAVAAMSEIEKSAQQISQIIGVIDEIAFQTNLLALNAGVEAARAGDAGRGFAVVASEVRALAQRSADAAKEIKALISASSEQVGQGVSLVGQTGEALTRIVEQVADITTVVSEIAASAQEQATGLHQVNTAVNQMDQVTQQNAAMVEQSTAASHSLAQESEELARLISRFQVGQDNAAASARRPTPTARPAGPVSRPALKTVSTHAGGGGAMRQPETEPAADVDTWEEF
ncbi:HAMP domain-containing methyl-accepting chemotaxis protein [Phenylobacterium sp.]|uniref:HAMP domain-containing methyl-accepting chemotaxis protein n=1 Tax=Phenylobacterium sp. TaxID=1871053 RepID=UPI002BBAE5C6|nr:methyl-accepting chemotaxis protein [Phenylobacterium sp.]HVI31030.1 methyl-accepting chemotaxis protein [Phenylobacterium sp.]